MIITKDNAHKFGLKNIDYSPPLLFRNAHFSTMFPYAFRKRLRPVFDRSRFSTSDGDFLDLDFIYKECSSVILLLHGLEGSSESQYILGLIASLSDVKVDICAMNHRSCSGEINKNKTMYHSGYIDDLIEVVNSLSTKYDQIFLCGYSLGGSMILNYLGRHQHIPKQVKAGLTFSVPIDLTSSAVMLNHWKNKAYTIQFLSTLNKKILSKVSQFPDELKAADYENIKNLTDYDNKVTAPLHGFKSAKDYYKRASSKPYLQNIKIPTLSINSHDDSFLAPPCFPYKEADGHQYFHFLGTKHGGHCGFARWNPYDYWSDEIAINWLNNFIGK